MLKNLFKILGLSRSDEGIEKFYTEDTAWDSFVLLCKDEIPSEELTILCGNDVGLAKVIIYHHCQHSEEFIHTKIPALDGLKPIECIVSSNLKNRLKECLLRTH